MDILDVGELSLGCWVFGDAEEGVKQWGTDKDGQGGLLLSSERQNITCKGTHEEWDFSCFPLLTNPLLVHLYKLVTFPDCAFMWKKPGEMWTWGGGLYYVSFTCYLSGIVMTNRDNQSLQQLLRFRIRWVGSYFFGRKRESSTNIHPIRDEFNVQTCKLGRPVTWNDMERRFWHSGWRQIQKSPSFNTKQWSSLELVVTEHKSWCICPAQGHDDFGTFTGTEPPNLHPHLLKPAEIFETTVLRLQAKKNKNKHDF